MLTDSQKYKVEFFKAKFKESLKCNEDESKIIDDFSADNRRL